MKTTDISRRNFLKGFMAAAGIAAAGIPMQQVEAVPLIQAPKRPVTIEPFDLWLRHRDVMRSSEKHFPRQWNKRLMSTIASIDSSAPIFGQVASTALPKSLLITMAIALSTIIS
ncbi:twin-arginine translocation signal domain-containing protein [Mesorhizobium sp. L-8-10]|uniref:twin-arginine translocation signal domain-containing protein n=1 Tax=Mesorhizobium sp. L-8-10 TaxID=2744523 RepID=UPI001928F0DF|nr:twin-arginine translocation signal domain-containing protein [Mesorhizobium sp. L-8-10]